MPAFLGLPLSSTWWAKEDGYGEDSNNHLVQILNLDLRNVGSRESMTKAGRGGVFSHRTPRGDMLLIRTDRQILRKEHSEALALYIDKYLNEELKAFSSGFFQGRTQSHVATLLENMRMKASPEAFVEFWYELKEAKIRAKVKGWKEVECPAELAGDEHERVLENMRERKHMRMEDPKRGKCAPQ